MGEIKRTALQEAHKKYGGKLIEFAGWELPVQYEGILEEHEAVRNAAGLFDVSHMGEITIEGPKAQDFVQYLVTNDVAAIDDGQIIYALMCYEDGGVVDDVLIYKFNREYFYVVINAGNIERDYQWMMDNIGDYDVQVNNISKEISEIALQGPRAEVILQKLTAIDLGDIKFFNFINEVSVSGVKCLISRSGYTGEDGFEIYASNEDITKLWEDIIDAGKPLGLKPAGLGCRDTLRFEAALPLYGNEISEKITPLEAGLDIFVKLNKENFIGKDALLRQKKEGLTRKMVGFEMLERGIPRHGYRVTAEGKNIGVVTTGYLSPTLKRNIGLAIIDSTYTELDTEIFIEIRNKTLKAKVINKKFYNKNYKK